MELFTVKNRDGKQIGKPFNNKQLAKAERDRLQMADNKGLLPKPEERQDPTKWDYRVSVGKDHRLSA